MNCVCAFYHMILYVGNRSCGGSAKYQCLSYSLSVLYSICATTALKLQPALGTPRGGPRTELATEAGSQLIGSCVSGTQRQCQSQHFPSLFPRSLSFSLLLLLLPSLSANHRRRRLDISSGHALELICTL